MRLYTDDEERRVRLRASIREWQRSRLIEPAQAKELDADVEVDLRRTGPTLRLGLALFTVIIVNAAVALLFTVLGIRTPGTAAAVAAFAALICLAAANALVSKARVYRYGVEETLAVAGVALLAGSAGLGVTASSPGNHVWAVMTSALVAGAVGAVFVNRRFGFQYAAVGAMVCLALIPFQFSMWQPLQRLLAAAVFATVFWRGSVMHVRYGDEFPGDEGASLQATAFIGMYLALNLLVTPVLGPLLLTPVESWFRWVTFGAIWTLPTLGLLLAVRGKDRQLLGAGLIAALATLVTTKPYLRWPMRPWDPVLFGALLMFVAIAVRWLAAAPGGERGGFTPLLILARDADAIRLAGIASVGMHTGPDATAPPDAGGFDGGRSGGGGGGADF